MENRKHHTTAAEQHDVNRLFGCEVLDSNRESIGTIDNVWVDNTNQPAFFGIKTGWLFGKLHVVPAHHADVSYDKRRVRLPHSQEKIKDAPSFDASADLSPEQEDEVYRYYGLSRTEAAPPSAHRPTPETRARGQAVTEQDKAELPAEQYGAPTARHEEPELQETARPRSQEEKTMQLNEEEAHVRKHERDAGGVRLRKIVRTESVNEPVELKHEDVEIERVPAREGETAPSDLGEDEVYIPLRREEAEMTKETHPKEQIRVDKKTTSERKDLSGEVRKEDVEIEREDENRKYGT